MSKQATMSQPVSATRLARLGTFAIMQRRKVGPQDVKVEEVLQECQVNYPNNPQPSASTILWALNLMVKGIINHKKDFETYKQIMKANGLPIPTPAHKKIVGDKVKRVEAADIKERGSNSLLGGIVSELEELLARLLAGCNGRESRVRALLNGVLGMVAERSA